MTENTENTTVETTEETNENGRFYTNEEIELLKQKIGDQRISQYQKTIERKNREAEKLRNMNDTEKYEYELSERERILEEKEKQLALAENKNEASKILADKGLSLSLVDFVLAEDADTMSENIKKLEKAFKASVKLEVEKRIGTTAPKTSNVAPETLTREQFSKLPLYERQKIYNEDKELYNSLTSNN